MELAVNKTLKNIKQKLRGDDDDIAKSTVLWSGNGYHIIQPVECQMVLENIIQFQRFYNPSQEFLRFAKYFLSHGKADKNHNPSFSSCLLRIPNSFNSKCLARGESPENSKVNIIQKWNGSRSSILGSEIIYDFQTYLIQKKIDEQNQRQIMFNVRNKNNYNNFNNYYEWIEDKILQTPFEDCRKIILSLILAPYLINIKKLPYQESFDILIKWLQKCDLIRNLDFNPKYLVKTVLNIANQKRIPPMKLETLRNKNLELYHFLQKPKHI